MARSSVAHAWETAEKMSAVDTSLVENVSSGQVAERVEGSESKCLLVEGIRRSSHFCGQQAGVVLAF